MSKSLPGAHLDNSDEGDVTDSVVQVVRRFAFKSVTWVAIYLLGYYDFSVAWLVTPLLLSVLRSQWKKERDAKLSAAREAALANEKAMIESRIRVEDLPTWVFFPDKDRAEWLNVMLDRLWPYVGNYTRKLIAESIEPAIRTALEGYGLGGFRFERVVLGQIPPRITGIKVYEKNVDRREIVLDVDVVHASDCDIKFTVSKFKAKINDFSLRGLMRIVFKPLINDVPLIGGVQAYFLTPPEIDFDLGGVANALDAPGLSNMLRKIVLEQISYFVVLPHKYTMALAANVETKELRCPDSAGVLRVKLHRATQLVKKDVGIMGMGKSDPYALLTVGARTVKTPKINNTVNPEWNFVADFPIEVVSGQQLTLEIMDHDDPGDDEFLGRASVQTAVVVQKGIIKEMWVDLEDIETGRALLSLSWMETSSDKSLIDLHIDDKGTREKKGKKDTKKEESANECLTKCVLHVFVDGCENVTRMGLKPCPMVEMRVGQTEVQRTFPQYFNSDPVFEQGFVFLVPNPDADDLHIKVLDTGKKEGVLGQTVLRISDVIGQPDMEYPLQPFPLKGGAADAFIKLSAQVKSLKQPRRQTTVTPIHPDPVPDTKTPSKPSVATPTADSKTDTPTTEPKSDTQSEPKSDSKSERKSDWESNPKPDMQPDARKSETPAVDEMVGNVMAPLTSSLAPSSLTSAVDEGLHRRTTTAPKIKLSLKYADKKLEVIVHEAKNLPGGELPDPPDPYVKLYLLPERNKKSKRKTEVIKDSGNPSFEESFDYHMDEAELLRTKLEVTVVDRKGIFNRSPLMGRAVVELDDLSVTNVEHKWFVLEEADDDSD